MRSRKHPVFIKCLCKFFSRFFFASFMGFHCDVFFSFFVAGSDSIQSFKAMQATTPPLLRPDALFLSKSNYGPTANFVSVPSKVISNYVNCSNIL